LFACFNNFSEISANDGIIPNFEETCLMNSLRKIVASVQSCLLWRYKACCLALSFFFLCKVFLYEVKAFSNWGKLAFADLNETLHLENWLDAALYDDCP